MPYKSFADFKDIQLNFGAPNCGLNYGYTAQPNFDCPDAEFFDNEFFLLYRRSEYAAQIELACAKIIQHLMGYGLEMEIVQEGELFFIASRKIKNFVEGCNPSEQVEANARGLISIFIIWYFIAQSDTHSGNYGVANQELAFGLDMAEALDFEMLSESIELSTLKQIPYVAEKNFQLVSELGLSRDYVQSKAFQNEKIAMIKQIAQTPFEVFATIIRATVTSNFFIHQQKLYEIALTIATTESERETIKTDWDEYMHGGLEGCSVESLISLLKIRHDKWKLLVEENLEEAFSQDCQLADFSTFMSACDLYHGGDDSTTSSDDEAYEPQRFFGVSSDGKTTNANKSPILGKNLTF